MAEESDKADSPEVRKYWQALGRFVHQFSSVETMLQMMLWHFAGVKSSVARAVFSGVRIEQAISSIRRIAQIDAHKKVILDQIDEALNQLGVINSVRNDILHYGAHAPGKVYKIVSNEVFALTPDKIRDTPISPEILEKLTNDLAKISGHLAVTLLPHNRDFDVFLPLVRAPWQYKPPSPKKREIPK